MSSPPKSLESARSFVKSSSSFERINKQTLENPKKRSLKGLKKDLITSQNSLVKVDLEKEKQNLKTNKKDISGIKNKLQENSKPSPSLARLEKQMEENSRNLKNVREKRKAYEKELSSSKAEGEKNFLKAYSSLESSKDSSQKTLSKAYKDVKTASLLPQAGKLSKELEQEYEKQASNRASLRGSALGSSDESSGPLSLEGHRDFRELEQLAGNKAPLYPYEARKKKQEGVLYLTYFVNQRGGVEDIKVHKSSGFEILDKEALTSVRKFRYRSGDSGWVIHKVEFRLIDKKEFEELSF